MLKGQNTKITRRASRLPPTHLQQNFEMPPIRQVLGEISGNRPRGKDLTLYKQGLIVRAYRFGVKEAVIIDVFSLSRKAVRGTLKNATTRPQGES
jgi:hypothetical protein